MRKVKNDPASYTKRADLGPQPNVGVPVRVAEKRKKAFLTAPIDQGWYIDFAAKPRSRKE
jgi:hypothetical protein